MQAELTATATAVVAAGVAAPLFVTIGRHHANGTTPHRPARRQPTASALATATQRRVGVSDTIRWTLAWDDHQKRRFARLMASGAVT
jgi:hypothetical protein